MKALRQNGNAIIMCIIEVVAGILLLVNPAGLTASIIIAAGIALMVDGLFWFIITFPVIAILYGVAVLIGGLGNPFSSTVAFWCFTGILLIAEAVVFDAITLVMSRKNDGSAEE